MFSPVNKSLFLLTFLAVVLPLAFGGTQPWAVFAFEAVTVIAFLAWVIECVSERYIAVKKTWLYAPVLVLLAFFAAQVIPLPAGFLKIISPVTLQFKSIAAEFCAGGVPRAMSLSMNPDATLSELVRFCCAFLVFFLAAHTVKSLKRAEKVMGLIFVVGFFSAVFAIIQEFSWNGKLYWYFKVPSNSGPFGSFVNYDHYGGYMNLLIMTGFGFMLSGVRPEKKILAGFMTAVMGASLFLSNSRGAVLSCIGGLIIFAALLILLSRNWEGNAMRKMLGAVILIVLSAVIFIYWIDWAQFTGRLRTVLYLEGNFLNPRLDIWRDSLSMARDFTIAGTGFGTYGMLFGAYQKTHLDLFWRYTHCDYLQLLIEAGPLAVLCVIVFIALLFSVAVRKIKNSRNNHLAGLLAGCIAALATMVLHSIVDFNMHITSNSYLTALIGGIAFALTRIGREKETGLWEVALSKNSSILAIAGGGMIAVLLMAPSVRTYAAHRCYSRSLRSTEHYTELMEKASRLAPGNAVYHHELGLLYQDERSETAGQERDDLLRKANKEFCAAVLASPAEGKYWASLAWNLANLGEKEKSREAMSYALRVAPFRPEIKKFKDNYEKTFGI